MSEKDLDEAQKNQRKIGAAGDDPHTSAPTESLRDKAVQMVEEDERSSDPMSPENIRQHEPTSVIRDQDSKIVEEGQAGTTTEEAREKYRKSGITET